MKPKIIKQLPFMDEPYIKTQDDTIMIDCNLANFDIVNYKIVNNIYQSKCNVIKELIQSNLNITDDTDYKTPENIQLLSLRKISFEKLFELYCILKKQQISNFSLTPDYRLELIENNNSLVRDAYNILGHDEVKRMKYHQSNIRREIIKRQNKAFDYKAVELIEEALPYYTAIPIAEIKKELQRIYIDLGMKDRKAKATDLKN